MIELHTIQTHLLLCVPKEDTKLMAVTLVSS